jgi:hypothetical protein
MLTAVLAGAIIGYAGLSFFAVAWDTAVQDHVPHRVLARVTSWDILTSYLALPVGNALAGPVSHSFGIDRTLVVCALILLGSSLAPLFVAGSRRLTRGTPEVALPPRRVKRSPDRSGQIHSTSSL